MSDQKINEILARLDQKLNPPTWKKILDFVGRYFFTIGFFVMGFVMMLALLGVYFTASSTVGFFQDKVNEVSTQITERINSIDDLAGENIDELINEQIRSVVGNVSDEIKTAVTDQLESLRTEIKAKISEIISEKLSEVNFFEGDTGN